VTKLSTQRDIKIDYRLIAEANHFFHNRSDELAATVDDYLDLALGERLTTAAQ
jgi:alpha/beta superfamily hydrolase